MPFHNSKENDIFAALEQTYRDMLNERTGPLEKDEQQRKDYDISVQNERKNMSDEDKKKYSGDPDFEGAREKQSIRQGRQLPNPSFDELKRRMGDSPRTRKPTEKIKTGDNKNTIKKK